MRNVEDEISVNRNKLWPLPGSGRTWIIHKIRNTFADLFEKSYIIFTILNPIFLRIYRDNAYINYLDFEEFMLKEGIWSY